MMDSEDKVNNGFPSTGVLCAEPQHENENDLALMGSEAANETDPEVTTKEEVDNGEPHTGGWGWMIAIGFLVMNFCIDWCKIRRLVLIGGSFMVLSAILSSLANQLTLLICLQSGLLAIGQAMLISPGQVLVGRYFKKRQKLALAFTECGVSIGNLLVPPLVSYLLEQYALQGTLLLYGGICLNTLPAALLHRPLSYYTKHRSRKRLLPQSQSCTDDKHSELNQVPEVDVKDSRTDDNMTEFGQSESEHFLSSKIHVLKPEEGWVGQDMTKFDHNATKENTGCSEVSHSSSELSEENSRFNRKCAPVVIDCSILKSPMFYLFMLSSVTISGVGVPVDYLPALVRQHGLTESQAALLLSIIGGLDLVCRVTCAVIVSFNRVRVSTMVICASVVLATVLHCVRFMETFEHFVVLAIFLGLLVSVVNCMYTLLVLEMLGLDKLGKGLGWGQLSGGIATPALYPFLGYIRDTTGSYAIVYHVNGGIAMLTAVLLLCVGPVRRWEHRRQRNEH